MITGKAALISVAVVFLLAFAAPAHAQNVTEPSITFRFNVFTSKTLDANITPAFAGALPGGSVNYRVFFTNRNPVSVQLNITADIPPGWSIDIPQSVTIPASGSGSITLAVTSNASAAEGAYRIVVRFENRGLSIGGSVVAQYAIGLRGTPAVTVSPQVAEGVAGSSVTYNVTITNTDPGDFDASTIALSAIAPDGWKTSFNDRQLRIASGASASTLLVVTSPENVDKGETIIINATANRLSGMGFAEYRLTTCGDGVCQPTETCSRDCPTEAFIFCSGRCESEVDDGVAFSATFSQAVSKFIVCDRKAAKDQCLREAESGACKFGSACLCSDGSACSMRCVDSKGAYYMLAQQASDAVRSNANYSYTCPFVNLPEIMSMRDRFSEALDAYERARSGLLEASKTGNASIEDTAPCLGALDVIISKASAHLKFLNAVVDFPARSNTTLARTRTAELRSEIDSLYNNFCRGAKGALRIVTFVEPRVTEIGAAATSILNVRNNGTTPFFGIAECDYLSPSGKTLQSKSSCTQVAPSAVETFTVAARINETGEWSVSCRILGSVQQDCAFASVHDATQRKSFSTFTRDVFVIDVSGSFSNGSVVCEVRSANPACAGCRAANRACSRLGESANVARFSCPPQQGFATNITGFVFASDACNPTEPREKSIVVLAPGCGNGILDEGEACEPPNSDNNTNVVQTTEACVDKRSGSRDAFGFCTNTCAASQDAFKLSCIAGKCGASCNDGETKNVTVRTSAGSCVCMQQCGATCAFNECTCEPTRVPGGNTTTTSSVNISLTLGHAPATPEEDEDVVITAVAQTNGTLRSVKIFVDGFLKKQCNTLTCTLSDKYSAGTHTYFATAENEQNLVSNPLAGTKSFTVRAKDDPSRPVRPPPCSISIQSKRCTFDESANRYTAEINVVWDGGDHAHGTIDSDESRRMTDKRFDFQRTLAGPGLKAVRAEVHDANDRVVCSDTDEIFCGGGTTTGELSLIRDIGDTVRVGSVDTSVSAISPAATAIKLVEKIDRRITARGLSVSGNTTFANLTGPVADSVDVGFNVYTVETSADANRPLVLGYTAEIASEGEYKFVAEATALGETKRNEKVVKATSCTQTFPVMAISADGICTDFPSSCDVPEGWEIVEECPEGQQTEPPRESPLLPVIVIIIIIVIVAVGIKYRDRIRERINRLRHRREDDELV